MTRHSEPHLRSEKKVTRRSFSKAAALGAFAAQFGAAYIPAEAFGKMQKPALAGIGAGGKGRADLAGSQNAGFEIAALVDVVEMRLMSS